MARVGSGRAASDILSGQMDQTMTPAVITRYAQIWQRDKRPGCLFFLFLKKGLKRESFEEGSKQPKTKLCLWSVKGERALLGFLRVIG